MIGVNACARALPESTSPSARPRPAVNVLLAEAVQTVDFVISAATE